MLSPNQQKDIGTALDTVVATQEKITRLEKELASTKRDLNRAEEKAAEVISRRLGKKNTVIYNGRYYSTEDGNKLDFSVCDVPVIPPKPEPKGQPVKECIT